MILASFKSPSLARDARPDRPAPVPALRLASSTSPHPLIDRDLGARIIRLARLAAEEHARQCRAAAHPSSSDPVGDALESATEDAW